MVISYKQIRSATGIIKYGNLNIIVDPLLAPKGEYPGFSEAKIEERRKWRNPLLDLPEPVENIIKDIDAVILTHTHLDHWDPVASKLLPKDIPIFVQHASDKMFVSKDGFKDVRVVGVNTPFKGITITKTFGQHGSDEMYAVPEMAEICDESMGFVLKAPNEKVVYFAGDTIWNEYVELSINKHHPDIIVLNTGDAEIAGFPGSLIMNTPDVETCYNFAKNSK